MTRSRHAWIVFLATRCVALVADTIILAAAYLASFLLRFDFQAPHWGWRAVAMSFVTVALVQLSALILTGCYAHAWRQMKVTELPRYFAAAAMAVAVLTLMRFAIGDVAYAHVRPPYTITLMTAMFATMGFIAVRLAWRLYWFARQKESELLEREEFSFDNTVAARFFSGKTVMVTGAGGSIGSELVRQVAGAGAAAIVMVERGENALYEIDRELDGMAPGSLKRHALLMDFADPVKMSAALAKFKPQVVLHAAAYKHVPMVERNPEAGWENNAEATGKFAAIAKAAGVGRFVMISTDKAVNPVSVMGKTKLAAEKAIMALNEEGKTSFAAVRFGNVMGSSGSVVPLFREQIAKGGPLTVTHPDMKRYFMTLREAVNLVLQAASRSERAIYTLDMGSPVRIVDLAEGMIRQAGLRPYVDVPIVFTGIRPGEKLFEELDISDKSCYKTDMAKIYITK